MYYYNQSNILIVICVEDSSGSISTVELLYVLRAMGQNPSEEELNGIIMEIDIGKVLLIII